MRGERGERELNVESGNCVGLPGLGLGHRTCRRSHSGHRQYDVGVYTHYEGIDLGSRSMKCCATSDTVIKMQPIVYHF